MQGDFQTTLDTYTNDGVRLLRFRRIVQEAMVKTSRMNPKLKKVDNLNDLSGRVKSNR
jgi:hypothetical protein